MKKFSILIAALLGLTLTACEDVPAPYEVIFNDDAQPDFEGAILPYTSANLSAGFEIYTPTDYPSLASWSTGSSYVQITGYVDADGDGTKEYNYTQSWLISPALYTATTESLVLNFDYTIRYANSMNAAELAANHKVLVSKDYEGDVALATWKELNFKPKASPYSDWTLYGSGDIEIPAEFQNCDNVHVAFYYQVTDLKKVSTWELQNLMIYAGIPEETPDEPVDTGETKDMPWTSASLNDFKAVTVKGIDWSLGSTYAKASGYVNSSYTETDAWLVSPAINTKTSSGVVIDVQHVIRYTYSDADLAKHTMWASTDYDGDVSKATWTKLNYRPVASTTNSWDFYPAKTVGLPEALLNKEKVYIAYRYECSSESASTWELKEFSIKEGVAPIDDDPQPGTPAEEITIGELLTRADPNTTYRLTGTVQNIVNTLYGNFDLVDATGSIYIYGLLDKDGNSKNFESLGIKEGDQLTLEGKYMDYNGKAEISNAQYISHVSGGDGPGPSTPAEQITIADFLSKADPNTTYRLTGKVSNITNTQYGNFDLTDATGTIYIYGLLDKDGNTKNFESLGIKEGDEITIEGNYNEYNGSPQIKNAQYISGGSGGDDPGPGTTVEQITIADFLSKADPSTTYRLTGKVSNITNTQYGNFDLTDATGTIYIYGLLDKDGNTKNFESLGIKEGDEITVEGNYNEYNGNPQIKNAQYISGGSGSGGDDDPGTVPAGEYITFSFSENVFGIDSERQSEAKTYTYGSYSITITPAGEGNSFYYNTSSQYFILGKQDATLEFNGFDFAVSAIEITGRDAASASVVQNIFVGDTAVSTETTGAKGTNVYNIASGYQAAGTHYTLKVLSNHNTQITEVKIYKAQ